MNPVSNENTELLVFFYFTQSTHRISCNPILKIKSLPLHKKCPFLDFPGLYFPLFRLNMEIYRGNLCIHSKCGKIQTRNTPNMDTFYAVWIMTLLQFLLRTCHRENCKKIHLFIEIP